MKTEGLKYFIEKKLHWFGLSLLFLFSCKNSGPEIISTTPQPKAAIYYGVITINKTVLLDDGALSNPTGELLALFSVSPLITNNVIGATSLDVGGVTVNDHQLTQYTKDGTTFYEAPLNTFIPPPYLCVVSGTNNVQTFSYKIEGNFPDYLGYSLLPDTINSKSILVINLADITNADEVEVYITDRVSTTTTKHVNALLKSVSFTINDLSHLIVPSKALIVVTCYKTLYETFNGKKYKFRLGYKVEKYNVHII